LHILALSATKRDVLTTSFVGNTARVIRDPRVISPEDDLMRRFGGEA
jgi:hypothetical protein